MLPEIRNFSLDSVTALQLEKRRTRERRYNQANLDRNSRRTNTKRRAREDLSNCHQPLSEEEELSILPESISVLNLKVELGSPPTIQRITITFIFSQVQSLKVKQKLLQILLPLLIPPFTIEDDRIDLTLSHDHTVDSGLQAHALL